MNGSSGGTKQSCYVLTSFPVDRLNGAVCNADAHEKNDLRLETLTLCHPGCWILVISWGGETHSNLLAFQGFFERPLVSMLTHIQTKGSTSYQTKKKIQENLEIWLIYNIFSSKVNFFFKFCKYFSKFSIKYFLNKHILATFKHPIKSFKRFAEMWVLRTKG